METVCEFQEGSVAQYDPSFDSIAPKSWFKDVAAEAEMDEAHAPFWRSMVRLVRERDLVNSRVLDFGCSRGGFLRMLYKLHRFQKGVGIDMADSAVAEATRSVKGAPIEYHIGTSAVTALKLARCESFHLAFSYEVIYLLRNLQRHAEDIFQALAPGGTYYAATGCHTDMPLWESWKGLIEERTQLAPCSYSINDFAGAFKQTGFNVEVQSLRHTETVPYHLYPEFFPNAMDAVDYFYRDVIVFRCTKPVN